MTKDIYPGCWDAAAGGVVLAGESYEESAQRELEEELGIRAVPLASHFDFYYEDPHSRVWGRVFSCVYDGELRLQAEEVQELRLMTIPEIFELVPFQLASPLAVGPRPSPNAFRVSLDSSSKVVGTALASREPFTLDSLEALRRYAEGRGTA